MKHAVILSAFLLAIPVYAHAGNGDLRITPVSDNVFVHTSYRELPGIGWYPSNGLIVVDGKRAVLVDTAWTIESTREIVAWVKARGLELDYAIVTHSHDDRTAGLAYLDSLGVETYASARTNEILEQRGEVRAANRFPASGAPRNDTLIRIFWPGRGHAPDNHVVWIPEEEILFGGCLVKGAESKTMGNVADADITAWGSSVAAVLEEFPAAKVVVPGHGDRGGPELLRHTRALIEAHNENAKGGS